MIAVPGGIDADVLEISPPLVIDEAELDRGLAAVAEVAGW